MGQHLAATRGEIGQEPSIPVVDVILKPKNRKSYSNILQQDTFIHV
jgi:hypothetical protein